MKKSDFQTPECRSYELSLEKITKVRIKDIHGYVSYGFGDPTFKLTRIIFEDGSELDVEGEHDMPYVVAYDDMAKKLNIDYESLDKIEEWTGG